MIYIMSFRISALGTIDAEFIESVEPRYKLGDISIKLNGVQHYWFYAMFNEETGECY